MQPKIKTFDFLDSFRGLAAMSVVMEHTGYSSGYAIMGGCYFGVPAFFLLSAFLLTYRLLIQYEHANNNVRQLVQTTFNYFVTRFFRIYATFCLCLPIYGLLEWLVFNEGDNRAVFIDAMKLNRNLMFANRPRHSHFWTIPVEVAYYFFIPAIAFAMSKLNSKRQTTWICLATAVFMVVLGRHWNREWPEHWTMPFQHFFPIFFLGSLIAYCYKRLEDMDINNTLRKSQVVSSAIVALTFGTLIFGLRFPYMYEIRDAYTNTMIWAVHMFLMLIGYPNTYTNWMSGAIVLKAYGKYSFGVYLLHIIVQRKILYTGMFANQVDKLFMCLFLSLLLGIAFYHIVEKNMIRLAQIVIRYTSKYFVEGSIPYLKI